MARPPTAPLTTTNTTPSHPRGAQASKLTLCATPKLGLLVDLGREVEADVAHGADGVLHDERHVGGHGERDGGGERRGLGEEVQVAQREAELDLLIRVSNEVLVKWVGARVGDEGGSWSSCFTIGTLLSVWGLRIALVADPASRIIVCPHSYFIYHP